MDQSQRFESFEIRLNDISHASSTNKISPLNNISDCTLPMDNTTDLIHLKYLVMAHLELIW